MSNEKTADQFHQTMNNLHPKLKFEIEKPEITPQWPLTDATRFQSYHIQGWQKLFRILQKRVCSSSFSYTQDI